MILLHNMSPHPLSVLFKKYIRDNSPIQTFVYLADKYIWADNVMPTVHVQRPPDFRNATQRARFNDMVFRLESTRLVDGAQKIFKNFLEFPSFIPFGPLFHD